MKVLPSGELRVDMMARRVGSWKAHVKWAGRELYGSPVAWSVVPGEMVLTQCTLTGKCLGARWTTHATAQITLQLRDAVGNRLSTGGARVTATLVPEGGQSGSNSHGSTGTGEEGEGGGPFSSPAPSHPRASVPGTVADNRDGTYVIRVTPRAAGSYLLHVEVDRHPLVPAIPARLRVYEGQINVTSTKCSGALFERERFYTGDEVEGMLVAVDDLGKRLMGGNDHFQVRLVGHVTEDEKAKELRRGHVEVDRKEYPATVRDQGDGSYHVSVQPRRAGVYTLVVRGRSGFLDAMEVRADRMADHLGADDRGKGVLKDASKDWLDVKGYPKEVSVSAGRVKPWKCSAYGGGLGQQTATILTGKLQQFTIHMRDTLGNQVLPDEEVKVEVKVALGEWEIPHEMVDMGDGKYRVSYLPDLALAPQTVRVDDVGEVTQHAASMVSVRIQVNGEDISGSPFLQAVQPSGVDPQACWFMTPPESIMAGQPTSLVVQSAGKDGKALSSGGALFQVKFEGHPGLMCDVHDNQDGKYTVRLLAQDLGHYEGTVSVKYGGQHILGSPHKLDIIAPGVFKNGFWTGVKTTEQLALSNFVVNGPGADGAVAGEEQAFDIVSRK